jgi:hypothetical protein
MKAQAVLNAILRDIHPINGLPKTVQGDHPFVIHSDITGFSVTARNCFISAVLMDGRRLDGRIYRKSFRFTGTVTDKSGSVKKYRSAKKA